MLIAIGMPGPLEIIILMMVFAVPLALLVLVVFLVSQSKKNKKDVS